MKYLPFLFLFACSPKLYLNIDCIGETVNETPGKFSKKYPLTSSIEIRLDISAMKISSFSPEKNFVDLYKKDMQDCIIQVMKEE